MITDQGELMKNRSSSGNVLFALGKDSEESSSSSAGVGYAPPPPPQTGGDNAVLFTTTKKKRRSLPMLVGGFLAMMFLTYLVLKRMGTLFESIFLRENGI